MVGGEDVVLALSWSGETVELAAIITYAKRFAIPLIAMTARAPSAPKPQKAKTRRSRITRAAISSSPSRRLEAARLPRG